jgi:hypothetical protein
MVMSALKQFLLLYANGISEIEFYRQQTGMGLGHRVIATAAPGMAADNSFQGQPAPVERTMFDNRFSGILGTGRRKPAAGGGERGN